MHPAPCVPTAPACAPRVPPSAALRTPPYLPCAPLLARHGPLWALCAPLCAPTPHLVRPAFHLVHLPFPTAIHSWALQCTPHPPRCVPLRPTASRVFLVPCRAYPGSYLVLPLPILFIPISPPPPPTPHGTHPAFHCVHLVHPLRPALCPPFLRLCATRARPWASPFPCSTVCTLDSQLCMTCVPLCTYQVLSHAHSVLP